MNIKQKMIFGAVLSICGGISMALGPAFGFSNLGVPWSFITGFTFGVISGLGSVLAISGLVGTYQMSNQKI